MKNKLFVYTDGSGNQGNPIGWVYVIVEEGKVIVTGQGSKNKGTNNQAELNAVISALFYLNRKFKNREAVIVSDSQYIVKAINDGWLKSWKKNGWKRAGGKLSNPELWKFLDKALDAMQVVPEFKWVRGHTGVEFNELADSLADEAKTNGITRVNINNQLC